MEIFFNTPIIWVFLTAILAFAMAYFTYHGLKKVHFYKYWPNNFLLLLRFLGIWLLLLLLLSPFIKYNKIINLKPNLLVLMDNSISMKNETNILNKMQMFNQGLKKSLAKFDIHFYDLSGNKLINDSFNFDQDKTDLTAPLLKVSQHVNQQTQAVLLLSDGIINDGANPAYFPIPIKVPLYTIGVGDTNKVKDLKVSDAKSNEYVILGNTFPLLFNLIADKCKGASINFTVTQNGQSVATGTAIATNDDYFFSKQILLTALSSGIQKIVVKTNTIAGEKNIANNIFELYVNVIDTRKKIAIYHQGVHPDIKSIYLSLLPQKNYEIIITNNITDALKTDLIIGVQVPNIGGDRNSAAILKSAKQPLILVGGEQIDWAFWSDKIGLLQVKNSRPSNAQFSFNPSFNGFLMPTEYADLLKTLPPLNVPFGNYPSQLNAVAFQSINGITTNYPLIATSTGEKRMTIFFGEGLWHWYQTNYKLAGNHLAIEKLMDNILQWTISKSERPLFSVKANRQIYNLKEDVLLSASLFNQVYEPILSQKVTGLILGDSLKKEFVFAANGIGYDANIRILKPGNYTVYAKTGTLTAQTAFNISVVSQEQRVTTADWNLLRIIAQNGNGNFTSFNNVDLLINELKQKLYDTVIEKKETTIKDFINIPLILILIIAFFSTEWVIRKYHGQI